MRDFEKHYSVEDINQFLLITPHHVKTQVGILLGNGCVSGDIARHAVQAYHNGFIKKLILSGGATSKHPPLYDVLSTMGLPIIEADFKTDAIEADYMLSILLESGVAQSDILLVERESSNTGENFEFIESTISAAGIQTATIFGVAYAARRAYQTAKRVMPDINFYSHPVYPYGLDRDVWLNNWHTIDYIRDIIIAERQKLDPHHHGNYYDQGFCVPVELPKTQVNSYLVQRP